MLAQMDPALVTFCDKISAQGGPIQLPYDMGESLCPSTPVVQQGTTTRASARLRNVQPDLNLDQSYEALRRSKKHLDYPGEGCCIFRLTSMALLYHYLFNFHWCLCHYNVEQ